MCYNKDDGKEKSMKVFKIIRKSVGDGTKSRKRK